METVKNAEDSKKEKWRKIKRKVKTKKLSKTKMRKWKIYHKQKRVVKRTLNETRECEFPKETHMLIHKTLKGFTR